MYNVNINIDNFIERVRSAYVQRPSWSNSLRGWYKVVKRKGYTSLKKLPYANKCYLLLTIQERYHYRYLQ